jgi:EAL domain-containing protein (putative c-di-GMP-specific phosphodiesterase class I)/DNA-binding NarL/FixJ family response regulator
LQPNTAAARLTARSTTVVVAEDDPRERSASAGLVEADPAFLLVATAADADEAIEAGRRWRPQIMVIDASLPKGGGARVVHEVSVVSPRTRAVVLSDFADRNHVLQMLDAGAAAYLVKRAHLDLLDALRAVSRGHSVLSPEVTGHLLEERASMAGVLAGSRLLNREEVRSTIDARTFAVAFQPVFSLRSAVAVGVEALCRLPPGRGLSPDRWFAEARAVGLGVELELAVLSAALETARGRPEGLFLSVNVSPEVVVDPRFVDLVGASGEGGRLVIEITEHDVVKDYGALKQRLADLRSAGVRVAVDDVGAGYASFRHVLLVRPDVIKLDVALIAEIDTDPSRRALAAGIVATARELGATVVAEGIETQAQFASLTSIGVEFGQGYYLARPGPLPRARPRPDLVPRLGLAALPPADPPRQAHVGAASVGRALDRSG